MFQLKTGQEAFTPVEGPFAGRKFVPGQPYAEIPPGTSGRFTEIKEVADPPATTAAAIEKPARADSKKGEVKS